MCIKVHALALIGSLGNCDRVFGPGLNHLLNCRTTCVAVLQKARLQRPGIISELEEMKRLTICPSGWPRSNIVFTLIGISLPTFSLAVKLPFLKGQDGRTERNILHPWVINSLTLNLILCRKSQPNRKRISLLKRKAPHRRKRIQRKRHAKIKTKWARLSTPGFFYAISLSVGVLSNWNDIY